MDSSFANIIQMSHSIDTIHTNKISSQRLKSKSPERGGEAADDALLDELGIGGSKRAVLAVPLELLA